MIPHDVTRALLEDEAPGILAWAERWGWGIHIDLERLLVIAWFPHPRDGGLLVLEVEVVGFKALPPIWRFIDVQTGNETRRAFPSGHDSLLNSHGPNGIICAPWSRRAYSEHGGLHANWGGAGKWLDVTEGTVAHTLGDMLAVLHGRVQLSPGRLA